MDVRSVINISARYLSVYKKYILHIAPVRHNEHLVNECFTPRRKFFCNSQFGTILLLLLGNCCTTKDDTYSVIRVATNLTQERVLNTKRGSMCQLNKIV